MGRVFSKITRPIKNINVENRAQKVLKKGLDIPSSAPRYPSTQDKIEHFSLEHPEYLEDLKEKHNTLVDNMRKLQLDSKGPPPEIKSIGKPLPAHREKHEEPEYGFTEPQSIPAGKTTMRLAMQFISEHHAAPNNYTASRIASEHNLDKVHVKNVLQHFQTFQMHIPKAVLEKNPKLMESLDSVNTARPQISSSKTVINDKADPSKS